MWEGDEREWVPSVMLAIVKIRTVKLT